MGVVAPNAVGLDNFLEAIQQGKSGITFHQNLADLKFSCCIGGIPNVSEELKSQYLSPLQLRGFNSSGILYGCMAGIDAWNDAGFTVDDSNKVDYESGMVFGTGTSGVEKFREAIYKLDDQKVKRLGSTVVIQTMASGISAYLGGILGLGNQVTTNSSACTTGTEALIMGFERIQSGKAKRMLVGACSDDGAYIWGGFDAMRVMTYKHNDSPEKGSRPMSESASGFVPGSGAGALVLESLESALERGANIYAEVLGMVASFYANNRIPVTLPLIIAMTALTRMIILQSKDLNAINIIYEATGILILAIAAYIMTLKDKISLKKILLREKIEESDNQN